MKSFYFLFLVGLCLFPDSNVAETKFEPFGMKNYRDVSDAADSKECDAEIRQLGSDHSPRQHHRVKRSIGDHYEDPHCFDSFETSDKTIIR